ncbi:MAG: Glu/Leu/Phe/Val dehydrogenase [Rhizobiaceae bacterium]|nr:Glu/Leu/Phe/Val dehydrogenase [Rhizobiaceae bacterium]
MLMQVETRALRKQAATSSLTVTDITAQAAKLEAFDGHECIWLGRDEERGLTAIVAIHDTRLGPALGGTRVWPHETFDAALTDALRLSRGMTYKAAVANLPLGGGKAVIWADPARDKTPQLLDAYAEMLAQLDGQYFTAEDVGLSLADADYLRERARNVTGTTKGGSLNPSPVTAHGVYLGLKAAFAWRNGHDDLTGVRIAVQGLGSVGWALCERLRDDGAKLIVSDINELRVAKARKELGAETTTPDAILAAEADIFAPCALGAVLSAETIPLLQAGIVAGAANNQLAGHDDAKLLMDRGILYAPDYVINAGGLINVAGELDPDGYDRERVMARLPEIPRTLTDIFARAEKQGRPTNDVAREIAEERLTSARPAA